jgi:hypothetical protein
MIQPWTMLMEKLRLHPKAVCRQLIAALEDHKPLTGKDEREVLHALENTSIDIERILAGLQRNTLKIILDRT